MLRMSKVSQHYQSFVENNPEFAKALEAGATPDEVRQAVHGHGHHRRVPTMTAGLRWAEEAFEK